VQQFGIGQISKFFDIHRVVFSSRAPQRLRFATAVAPSCYVRAGQLSPHFTRFSFLTASPAF